MNDKLQKLIDAGDGLTTQLDTDIMNASEWNKDVLTAWQQALRALPEDAVIVSSRELAAYRELAAAARVIFEVSSKAGIPTKAKFCPHGNIPSYPSHARWCDQCFGRLEDALDTVSDIGKDEG